jgi:uncharacterized RDD family membrane protein YckC
MAAVFVDEAAEVHGPASYHRAVLDHRVTTPENVDFHFTLAGPGTRLLAWLADLAIVGSMILLGIGVASVGLVILGGYAEAITGIFTFVVATGYWIFFEHRWQGRTPGKRMFGLRVVGERGLRLDLGQVVLRNVLRLVDLLPGFGALAAGFLVMHPEHRRLGDVVAGTLVIRERRVPAPERLRNILGAGSGRVGAKLLPVDAKRRLTREQCDLLLDLCLRRDALDDAMRMRLFATVATDLRAWLQPAEGPFGALSDEKLVLIATAELFERRS